MKPKIKIGAQYSMEDSPTAKRYKEVIKTLTQTKDFSRVMEELNKLPEHLQRQIIMQYNNII